MLKYIETVNPVNDISVNFQMIVGLKNVVLYIPADDIGSTTYLVLPLLFISIR